MFDFVEKSKHVPYFSSTRLQTRLDKLGDFTIGKPTSSHIAANISPRFRSRFDIVNKFSVDKRPDLPVQYLTSKEDLQIRQRQALFATIFGVIARSIERLSMTLTANGRRQKLNFLASILSRLYDKVKIFSFTVNKRFLPIFLLD